MYVVTIRHNFEAAHRLWTTPGKCHGLHGHSFLAEVSIAAPALDGAGMVVEFGALKSAVRGMLDDEWDHAVLLHVDDDLIDALRPTSRILELDDDPTTEHLAAVLGFQVERLLRDLPHVDGARLSSVTIHETRVNAATWAP